MYLYIDTSSHEKIILALLDRQGKILVMKKIKAIYQQSEKLLSSIEKIVGTRHGAFNLKGIIVVIGPGSFTSLRIGVATANAMAWSLNIPILGVEKTLSEMQRDPSLRSGRPSLASLDGALDKNFKKILNKPVRRSFGGGGRVFKQVLPKYGKEPNITINNKQ